MPFALALILELTWLTPQQRRELEAFGSRNPTADPRGETNVIHLSTYCPDRAPRSRSAPTAPLATPPRWQRATALAVIAASAGITTAVLFWPTQPAGEYLTQTGEQRSILLADGSTVTMNTQSRLWARFSSRERDVELLEGEALFSVAPDPKRPFRVHARHTTVEAIGTEFSVYLRPTDTKVAVTQGRVKMFASPGPGSILLNPYGVTWTDSTMLGFEPPPAGVAVDAGHEAWVARDANSLPDFEVTSRSLPATALQRQMAWVNGQLGFSDDRLDEVVEQFNRYNWRKLRIGDPRIAALRVGGWFRSTDLDEFVGDLSLLFGIRAVLVVDPRSREQIIELERQPTGPP